MKTAAGTITVMLALSIASEPGVAGLIGHERTDGRYYEPVEIPGEVLSSLTGTALNNLAVYSFENGRWLQILSQIDEVTTEGNFVLTHGPEANAGEGNGVLDKQDLIVFMARDSGEKAPEGELPYTAEQLVSVEIFDPLTRESAWVYITYFPGTIPVAGHHPYALLLSHENFNVRFSSYGYDGLTNDREKESMPTIFINKLWVLEDSGGNGENIIDRQKIRGNITFLGGMIEVPINEKIVSGGLVAYKPGGVRIITHSVMYPLFPLGIKGPRFYIDSIMVDTLTLTTTTVNVPFDPGSLISDMTLVFMTDLSPAAKGMYYYNSMNKGGFLIDGKMDDKELAFKNGKDEWRLITGQQGTQIQYTVFDPKFMTDGKASSTYNDNESEHHPPENFPGDIGAAADSINIKSLPAGSYQIKTFGCVPHDFYDPEGLDRDFLESILNISNAPLQIKVDGRTIENHGGRQRQVINK
jgi:hypothetical protein